MQLNAADTMGKLLKSKKNETEEKIIKFPAQQINIKLSAGAILPIAFANT